MKGRINTQQGDICFDQDVVAKYAAHCASECFGVVGLASVNMKDGLAKLLKGENITQGVNLTTENDELKIDLHIIVAYGVSISTVCENLMNDVKYRVQEFSGLKVRTVNVFVEGVIVMDDDKA